MKFIGWRLDLLYPPRCVFCRKLLKDDETDICRKCRATVPMMDGAVKRGSFFKRCDSLYEYTGDVAASLKRYKFGGMRQYATVYGRQLAMLLLREGADFDVLTWAPISAKRRRQRGYDQTRLLAEAVANELGVSCVQTLKKKRDNPAQSSQKNAEARRANVLNVYCAVEPERFAGRRILLIDDIITTGATLSECSRVLLTAGAESVRCATIAATQFSEKQTVGE